MKPGEASMTARRVAAQRLSFSRVPARWPGAPESDQRLQADVAAGLEVSTSPMTSYLRARTAFFDRNVVEAIDGGVDQMVLVGAGYDGRSLRYARPGVRWYELDHPDTQADKRSRLERLGIAASGVTFVAADFGRDDVAERLTGAGHDPIRPTLFACEGVAAYLPLEVLSSLLSALGGCAAPGSRLVITMALHPESVSEEARRESLNSAVAAMGEPLVSSVRRAELGSFLAASRWRITTATDPAGLDVIDSPRSTAFVAAEPVTRFAEHLETKERAT